MFFGTSMTNSRNRIVDRIRDGLRVNRAMLEAQAAAYPPPHPRGPFVPSDLDVVEQFRAELSALHAYVHLCSGPTDALEQVIALLEAAGVRDVLSWSADQLPLPELLPAVEAAGIAVADPQVLKMDRAAQYRALEPIGACITGVDAAIAESGTMIVANGAGRGRLASLLPPLHIALLPADNIVRTLPDAWDRMRMLYGDSLLRDRSNVVMITGPSRTADIELSLTLGVHGPREVHAIVIR